jgi:hypothetical protein
MKNIKKLTLSLLATCVLASSAMASESAFTLAEAQKNCATLSSISFKAVNPSITHSKGTLAGKTQSGVTFATPMGQFVLDPLYSDLNDISFRSNSGSYGYKSGEVTTCFYKYKGFTGVTVMTYMRGTSN